MNLMQNKKADYIVSLLVEEGLKEAKLYGEARCVASSEDGNSPTCPTWPASSSTLRPTTCTSARTRPSTARVTPSFPTPRASRWFPTSPRCSSEPMNVSDYGLIYGGVQKNIGPAGVVIVIVRDDLVREEVLPFTPTIMRYTTQAKAQSLSNTPPAYGIYVCGLVFKWLKEMGGLEVMAQRNRDKAQLLYDFLDQSKLFTATARKEDRSLMNVPFVTGDAELDAQFIAEAKGAGLESIKGHRSVGGMRASIYNAMPKAGVEALVAFMDKFERENA